MEFYSHGKLLITGEYFVLDGARALAIPTRQGQSLRVEPLYESSSTLEWLSYTSDRDRWFDGRFELPSGQLLNASEMETGRRLAQIFRHALTLRPALWQDTLPGSLRISTHLEFPKNWGLGTSSTLIANLAQWWQIDPYTLLAGSFGGSGYDLACAQAAGPIFYQLQDDRPMVSEAPFHPPFSDQLYFLFLEVKQDSREGIARYRSRKPYDTAVMGRISELSEQAAVATDLQVLQEILEVHEVLVSEYIGMAPVKERLFTDLPGTVKSLGAWGGDFVLVATHLHEQELRRYFAEKGFRTLIRFEDMVLPAAN